MTLLEEIYEAAAQAAPSGADEELLQRLCRISAAQWQARLKAGVPPEDCREVFICAAAWLAAAALESARAGGEELSSLRAGDMSVTKRAAADAARRLDALRAQAWALMRPYTKDGGFYFCRTQG